MGYGCLREWNEDGSVHRLEKRNRAWSFLLLSVIDMEARLCGILCHSLVNLFHFSV